VTGGGGPGRPPRLVPLAEVVAIALAEDLGSGWAVDDDVTARATVPAGAVATAEVVPRRAGVLAGLDALAETYRQVEAAAGGAAPVAVERLAADGDRVEAGRAVARVRGPARSVLVGERTALNLLTHLSGVATATRAFVDAVAGTGCAVRDTRKTLPGLRLLEKAAVVAGGGQNHRTALVSGLLVKDNHVAAAGGIRAAVRAALDGAGGLPVQVEVASLDELDVALAEGATAVLLDNFTVEDTAEGVRRCRAAAAGGAGPVFVEASGGITLATAAAVAATGVDAIAVGWLTHSAGALDLGLDVVVDPAPQGA
jgi:nicotinate-nucleotide pyrophosphorylase (carboxylating)